MSSVASGQPRVEWVHRPELNHVSRTSGSCLRPPESQPVQDSGSSTATMTTSQPSQYQAGMRWPHQSWRLTHQSRMFSIQL